MPAQLESTDESVAALAFPASPLARRTTSQRESVERDIHLELLAREFVRWFPEESREVAQAGARRLRGNLPA